MRKIAKLIPLVSLLLLPSCSGKTINEINYKDNIKTLARRMDNITSVSDTINSSNSKNAVELKKLLNEASQKKKAVDYTHNNVEGLVPNIQTMGEGIHDLLTIDLMVEDYKLMRDDFLRVAKYNQWLDNGYGGKNRVSYYPALNYVRFEQFIKDAYYDSFDVGETEEGKTFFTSRRYMGGTIFDKKAMWFVDLTYIEGEKYTLTEIRNFDDGKTPWVHYYGEFDFETCSFEAFNYLNQRVFEGFYYYNEDYPDRVWHEQAICDDGTVTIYRNGDVEQFLDYHYQKIAFTFGGNQDQDYYFNLYHLNGIESITCDKPFESYFDGIDINMDPFLDNIPVVVKTKNGKTLKESEDGVDFIVEAYYDREGIMVFVPYLHVLSFNRDKYENEYGLVLDSDVDEVMATSYSDNRELVKEKLVKFKEMGDPLYHPVSYTQLNTYGADDNCTTVKSSEIRHEIGTSLTGNVTVNNNEIDTSSLAFHVDGSEDYVAEEDYYVDFFAYSGNNLHILGSEKIDYKGSGEDFNLTSKLKLPEDLLIPGDYQVVIMLRNWDSSYHPLKAEELSYKDDNGFDYSINEDKNVLIKVRYQTPQYDVDKALTI